MGWCLIGTAMMMALLAIAALVARPDWAKIRPVRLLRGCAALLLLVAALALVALALTIEQRL